MASASPEIAAADRTRAAGFLTRVTYASGLVLFPLVWALVAGTGIHPSPAGRTAAEQAVAGAAGRWQLVHLALAGAALLGIGAVLALRSLVPRTGRLAVLASGTAAVGVAAGGWVAGIVLMESALVAPVTAACAESSGCLSPTNEAFLGEPADLAWNDLTALSLAAGTLLFCWGTLAVLGWPAKRVRPWEAVVTIVGIVGIYATNTVVHGDARYGLALVLGAGASIAWRMVRTRHG